MYFIQTKDVVSERTMEDTLSVRQQQKIVKSFDKISTNRFLVVSAEEAVANTLGYVSDVYRNPDQCKIVVLPRIVLSMKEGRMIDPILEKFYGKVSVEQKDGSRYILRCHLNHSKDVLDVIAMLNTLNEIEWCEPEMLSDYKSDNPLYSAQYYLKNTGQNGGIRGIDINAEPAWQITNGSPNIKVAVIDEGVDRNHEDMGNRVLEGYTVRNPNGYGVPQNAGNISSTCKGHGMACAGIIGATNNSIGIRGVASNINILPVNIVPDYFTLDYLNRIVSGGFGSNIEIAEAIKWAWQRADILSCSWGGGPASNDITSAINNARRYGRNGKGCVVVFASGNGYPSIKDVSFPGNVDGVITVGAIDNRGVIRNYSQRGASMDLVAPSGGSPGDVVTTDRMGDLGYYTGNYYLKFNGTSAACPQVAGVAALMLSANPALTEAQVRTILQNTAKDLGAPGFDHTYGYGLIDAYKAVNSVFAISGPFVVCSQETYTIQDLPSGTSIQWSTSNGNLQLVSGQGTRTAVFRKNGSGECTIRATLRSAHLNITLPLEVWAGAVKTLVRAEGEDHDTPFSPSTSLHIDLLGGLGLNNTVEFAAMRGSKHVMDVTWELHNETPDVISLRGHAPLVIVSPIKQGVGSFRMTAIDQCGRGTTAHVSVHISSKYHFTLSPNPAVDVVTLKLTGVEGEQRAPGSPSAMGTTSTYEIQLWSGLAMLRSFKTNQPTFQIPIAGLPAGLYFVRVIKDGQTYTEKLIKN